MRSTSTCRSHDLKFGGEFSRVVFPFEAHFNETGRVRLQHRRGVQRGEPGDLAVLDDDPEAGELPLPDLHDRHVRAGRLAGREPGAAQPRRALRPRHEHAAERASSRGWSATRASPASSASSATTAGWRPTTCSRASARPGTPAATARFVVRGGFGVYVTRNRPWFDATVQDQTIGGAVIIQDPQQAALLP